MTAGVTDKLYSKEQIEEWASKRADDAGRLSHQLIITMRDNERLREALKRTDNAMCWLRELPDPTVFHVRSWANDGIKVIRKALEQRNKESAHD